MQLVVHSLLHGWVMGTHLELDARYCTFLTKQLEGVEKIEENNQRHEKNLFKRKQVRAGMLLFAKLEVKEPGEGA